MHWKTLLRMCKPQTEKIFIIHIFDEELVCDKELVSEYNKILIAQYKKSNNSVEN